MKKAKLTISRLQRSDGIKEIRIEIVDDASCLNIIEISVSLENFTEALTGLGFVDVNITREPTHFMLENLGKEKEVQSVYIDRPKLFLQQERMKKYVQEKMERVLVEHPGWGLSDDGTNSQQHGDKHCVTISRYVEPSAEIGAIRPTSK